jgi:hypothetical protein
MRTPILKRNGNAVWEKVERDLALNISELMAATGYGRAAIKRIKPPLVCGKIRLSDFWKHVKALGSQATGTTTSVSPEASNDLRPIVAGMLAPRKSKFLNHK